MGLPIDLPEELVPMIREALNLVSELLAKDQLALMAGLEHAFKLGYESGKVRGINDATAVYERRPKE